MAAISRESGVLVGQIYRDFANKEAIVAAIVEHDMIAYLDPDILTCAIETRDKAALRGWIARFVACEDVDDPRLVTEIVAEAARNDRMAAILRMMENRLRDQLLRALRVIAPAVDDDTRLDRLAELILTMSAGMFQRRPIHPAKCDASTIAAMMSCLDRELDGLCGGIDHPAPSALAPA